MKTVNEILDAIAGLPLEQQVEVYQTLGAQIQYRARRQLVVGSKVSFRTRHGAVVEGTLVRVNPKSVKVRANRDRYGAETPYPVMWTVSPQLLSPVKP